MGKALFTYTTEISAAKSVAEIDSLLTRAGATHLMKELAGGEVSAISFRIKTEFGVLTLRLPARVDETLLVLGRHAKAGKMPQRWVSPEQARRVAWRVVMHWLEAQMAMIEVGNARLEQIMLPYVQEVGEGRTVYELLLEKQFALGEHQLALSVPDKGGAR